LSSFRIARGVETPNGEIRMKTRFSMRLLAGTVLGSSFGIALPVHAQDAAAPTIAASQGGDTAAPTNGPQDSAPQASQDIVITGTRIPSRT
jgi:hypothetical protein